MGTRRPREEEAGAIHHVIPQGNGRRRIVEDDRDRRAYLARFWRVGQSLEWLVAVSCLMDTHHHAVLETVEPNLGVGMQRVQGGHSRWLNARYGREGQVFRHRFWSRRVDADSHLFRACVYVVLNPVAAGLCSHPREWPWCSYNDTVNGDPELYAMHELRWLPLFGESPRVARARYAEVVAEAASVVRESRFSTGREVWASLSRFEASIGAEEQVSG